MILKTLDFFIPSNSHDMSERLSGSFSEDEKPGVAVLGNDIAGSRDPAGTHTIKQADKALPIAC